MGPASSTISHARCAAGCAAAPGTSSCRTNSSIRPSSGSTAESAAGSSTPIVSIVHQVLCRQPRRRWFNFAYRQVERGYLQTADAFIFNSAATRDQVRQLVGKTLPHCVARPAGSRLGSLSSQGLIAERSRHRRPPRAAVRRPPVARQGAARAPRRSGARPAGHVAAHHRGRHDRRPPLRAPGARDHRPPWFGKAGGFPGAPGRQTT